MLRCTRQLCPQGSVSDVYKGWKFFRYGDTFNSLITASFNVGLKSFPYEIKKQKSQQKKIDVGVTQKNILRIVVRKKRIQKSLLNLWSFCRIEIFNVIFFVPQYFLLWCLLYRKWRPTDWASVSHPSLYFGFVLYDVKHPPFLQYIN